MITKKHTQELKDVQDQSSVISKKRVVIIFVALALALFITCLDQTSVATSMPKIGEDLNAVSEIAWVGTSFLTAMTAFLLVNGRLSDIFGRKNCLLLSLLLLLLGDLLCGFAQSGIMLFLFRAISGIGAGGVNSLVMVVVSDITTLKERGKYQGILEAMIALGNGLGPLVGGAFSQQISWRWTFWFVVPLCAVAAGVVGLLLPKAKMEEGESWKVKVKRIDYLGVVMSVAAVVLLLVPISGGGSTYSWNSPLVIAMLTIGGVLAVLFVFVEWKISPLPVMPLRLFRKLNAKILLANNFIMGIVYFLDLYFIPLYFQNVRGYSPILSGVMILPLITGFSIGSSTSGLMISRIGITNPVIRTGFLLWTAGAGGRISWERNTHVAVLVVCQFIEGIGVGCVFQPAMIALLANTEKVDRAVATSLRNFARTTGGAIGLSIGSSILNNVLVANLPPTISAADALLQFTNSPDKQTVLTDQERDVVIDAYMKGIKAIMYLGTPLVGVMLIDSFAVTEVRLDSMETGSASVGAGNGTSRRSKDLGHDGKGVKEENEKSDDVEAGGEIEVSGPAILPGDVEAGGQGGFLFCGDANCTDTIEKAKIEQGKLNNA